MQRDECLPRVRVWAAAPTSVVFELQRMGRGWFTVERSASQRDVERSPLAVLRYVQDAASIVGEEMVPSVVPALDIVCSRSSTFDMTRCRSVERFDVAVPLQRLALLARLATAWQRAAAGLSLVA